MDWRNLIAFVCSAVLVLAANSAWAAGKPLTAMAKARWTTGDGLPHNQVNDIAQTPEGYLWFATWEGLVRYDGRDFLVLGPDSVPELGEFGIRAVSVAADGRLVVASARAGVAVREGSRWRAYGMDQGLAEEAAMRAVIDAQGDLWVAHANRGVSRIHPDGSSRQYLLASGMPSEQTYDIAVDGDGVAWVATNGGLARIDVAGVRSFGVADGLPEGAVYALRIASDGSLVIGTHRGVYRGHGEVFSAHEAGFPDEPVASLALGLDGTVFAGTVSLGLLRGAGSELEVFDRTRGLPNNRVPAVFRDREGSIWAGTSGGLLRFSDTPFSAIDTFAGLSDDYVRALLELPDGGMLIGSGEGLDIWHQGELQPWAQAAGLGRQSVLSLARDGSGTVWVGTYAGGLMGIRDGRAVYRYGEAEGLQGVQVRAIEPSRDGSLWVGTNAGLYRIPAGGGIPLRQPNSAAMPMNLILALHEDHDGRLWIGTATGLNLFEAGRYQVIDIRGFDNARDVFDFTPGPDGELWISTSQGLIRWQDGQMQGIGMGDGLPTSAVFGTVIDRQGDFWLSSNRGMFLVRKAAMAEAIAGRQPLQSLRFGDADGMASAQCNGGSGPAALMAGDGSIWVATARGASFIQPQSLPGYQQLPPPVVIESVKVDGVTRPLHGPVVLAPGQNRIEIRFASLGYRMASQIRYRYRMLGLDDGWVDAGRGREARFTHLPPGQYRFEIAAATDGSPWKTAPTVLDLEIQPPFWRKPVFVLVALLMTALLLAWVHVLRIGMVRHRERELAHQVALRTRDLSEKNLELSRMAETIRRQAMAFEQQASIDALTGLPNRQRMEHQLASAFADAAALGQPLCLALLQVDALREVNTRGTRSAGDALLVGVANVLRSCFPGENRVARWSSGEFAVLFPNDTLSEARQALESAGRRVETMDSSGFAPGLVVMIKAGLSARTEGIGIDQLVDSASARLMEACKDVGTVIVG